MNIQVVKQLEKYLGTVKFAVVIVLFFAGYLIYGTFVESWHGADYANRLVYKSIPFMLLQGLMFFSIFFATTKRFPFKKRLYGFYVLHLGILLLFLGSVVTYWVGIDGSITLAPNEASREVVLGEDRLRILFHNENKEVTYSLPFTHNQKNLNDTFNNIKLKNYLPFATKEIQWKPSSLNTQGSQYTLANDNFTELITLSIHPESPFKSNTKLGLLNIHYLPTALYSCFEKNNPAGILIFNASTGQCFVPDQKTIKTAKTSDGRRFVLYPSINGTLKFFPDFSPMPVRDDLSLINESPWRAFSKSLFEKAPHIFLFGKSLSYYDKTEEKWISEVFKDKSTIALPWMGFQISLNKDTTTQFPDYIYQYTKPIMDGGQVVIGDKKALDIVVKGQTYQVNNEKALSLLIDGQKVSFLIDKKTIKLPFELTLKKFNMDQDPGTNNPASYESYVDLFSSNNPVTTNHHIYMNNPLKFESLTFYQASYFDVGQGMYGSVLSVNLDPGRPVKYLGSLLLVLGSIWHFGSMAYRKKKRQTS